MLASSLSCVKFGYWEATGKSNWKKSVGMHFHHCQPHCNSTTDFWLCVYIDNALQDNLPQKCLCHAAGEVATASSVCSRSLSNILGKNRSEKWVGKSINVFQKCKKLEMLAIYMQKSWWELRQRRELMVDEDGLSSNIIAGGLLIIKKKKVVLFINLLFWKKTGGFRGGKVSLQHPVSLF